MTIFWEWKCSYDLFGCESYYWVFIHDYGFDISICTIKSIDSGTCLPNENSRFLSVLSLYDDNKFSLSLSLLIDFNVFKIIEYKIKLVYMYM